MALGIKGFLPSRPQRRQRFNLTNPQYLLAQALQKGISTGPARGGMVEGLSRLGQAFIAKQARDEAEEKFKQREAAYDARVEARNTALQRALGQMQPREVMVGSDAPRIGAVPKYETRSDLPGAIQTLGGNQDLAELAYQLQIKEMDRKNALNQALRMRELGLTDKFDEMILADRLRGDRDTRNRTLNDRLARERDVINTTNRALLNETQEANRQRRTYGLPLLPMPSLNQTASPSSLGANQPSIPQTVAPEASQESAPVAAEITIPEAAAKAAGLKKEAEREAALKVKRKEALPSMKAGIQAKLDALPLLERNMNKVFSLSRADGTFGRTGLLSRNLSPSGNQAQLDQAVVQFKGLVGLDRLVRLKQEGGTLGALSATEMDLLVSTAGSLDTLTNPQTLRDNIETVMYLYKKGIGGDIKKFNEIYPNETPFRELVVPELTFEQNNEPTAAPTINEDTQELIDRYAPRGS